MVDEMREQLLAWERELDSREGAIATWEYGLAIFECALGRACAERDAASAQAEVAWHDNHTRLCAFTSGSKHSMNFNRMFEERQILLSLQEMDLEVREAKLVEDQSWGLHPFDGWDLPTELEELRMRVRVRGRTRHRG
jgi:hypothetical protein